MFVNKTTTIGVSVLCFGFIYTGTLEASISCKGKDCRPASIRDVKNLIAKKCNLAPVPTTLSFPPVQIKVRRNCAVFLAALNFYNVQTDNIIIETQKSDQADTTTSYTMTCTAPAAADIRIKSYVTLADTTPTYTNIGTEYTLTNPVISRWREIAC